MSLGLIRVLLLGSGSREHAIAIALAQSSHLEKLYCAPGNPGIGEIAELVNLSILDREAVSCFCIRNDIALVVVGPEEPLYRGVSDALRARGIFVFGPSKVAARIEGDKSFAKWCMKKRWGVRTANYRSMRGCTQKDLAIRDVRCSGKRMDQRPAKVCILSAMRTRWQRHRMIYLQQSDLASRHYP